MNSTTKNSDDFDRALAMCLEDFHRRRALGETPEADDYRKRLGPVYADFQDVLAAETVLDEAIEPPEAPAFPQTFNGFTLLRELGRGAMGVVYEAVQRDLGRKVAVKVLRTGFQTEPTALERFRREAKACAQVRHDHIVEIYEAGEWDGQAYYSMAMLEGVALYDAMKQGTLPEPRELCRALAGVADALETLHAKGIVHRDVKPSNIMVEPSGRMVLADFGLARTIDSKKLTTTGHAVGTPLYMSPEQALARDGIDGRTDVYGLGATLYECLGGQPVFHAEGLADMLRQVLNERPKPLREFAPEVDADAESIAMMCLERRKEDRYESAAAMRKDLLAYADGREVAGKPVAPMVHKARRVARAWPAIAAVALGAVGLAFWSANRPATLTVSSFPPAEVTIARAGAEVGSGNTKFEEQFAPGEYEVVLRIDGFRERRETIRLEAGGALGIDKELVALRADRATIDALVAEAGKNQNLKEFRFAEFADIKPGRKRDKPKWSEPIVALFPRGRVLPEDLREGLIRVAEAAELGGTLEFRRGDEVLHSAPMEDAVQFGRGPKAEMGSFEVPAVQLASVEPGDEVSWGFYPSDGSAPSTTTFTLATVAEQAADRRQGELWSGQLPRTVAAMVDRHRLVAGLNLAVLRRTQQALAEDPTNEEAARVRVEAVRNLGLKYTPIESAALTAWDTAHAAHCEQKASTGDCDCP